MKPMPLLPAETFAPRRPWLIVAALVLIANGVLVARLLTRTRRQAESRATFAEFFKCRPQDVAITVRAEGGGPPETSGKDVERLRAELSDDVIVSEREHRTMANRVGLVAYSASEGTLKLPDGIAADWQRDNFLMIRYSLPGQKDVTHTVFFAPRTWLQKDL
jgi:hypothetical protein